MRLFSRGPSGNDLAKRLEAIDERLSAHEARLDLIGERLDVLRRLEEIEVEWQDTYDRFANLLKRWNQREKRAREAAAEPAAPAEEPINPMALRILQRGRE